ncbi:hypothetical protein DAEQUDRAFT_759143 [Daedalea quercina L-15889]|uniref:Uncharacterized protein n=1 Tax=Daedalea quercina L-15889 TaxID=1314783 RepID=A0A165MIM7_9APHY|nr:hypothetical protein DAEQUDRAFT_759143 [Daedalea quercina L-15889]
MRFTGLFSIALAAVTASVAVAHPVYDSMLTARADDDLSLYARELAVLDLLGREYADYGLSRRDDIDVVDLLRREYIASVLFARGGEEDKKPPKSAIKGGRESHGGAKPEQKVAFKPRPQVHKYSSSKPASERS